MYVCYGFNFFCYFFIIFYFLILCDHFYGNILEAFHSTCFTLFIYHNCLLFSYFIFYSYQFVAVSKYIYNKVFEESNIDNIHQLGTAFRYQDDLIIFQQYYNAAFNIVDSYPQEMIIKNTNVNINTVNYLDLTISILDNRYHYKSYDKRKEFNFQIIRYPNLSGNIPLNPLHWVFLPRNSTDFVVLI